MQWLGPSFLWRTPACQQHWTTGRHLQGIKLVFKATQQDAVCTCGGPRRDLSLVKNTFLSAPSCQQRCKTGRHLQALGAILA